MANPIPAKSRRAVSKRERNRCARCAGPGTDWHHRRGRSVIDAHTHCPCNGVLLCRVCHDWSHSHPEAAREAGFIVSRHVAHPGSMPVGAYYGWVLNDCDGEWTFAIGEV